MNKIIPFFVFQYYFFNEITQRNYFSIFIKNLINFIFYNLH